MDPDEPPRTYRYLENGFIDEGEIQSLFNFPLDDFAGLWFRGQSCREWGLRPSLLRREAEFGYGNVVTAEIPLNREFRRQAARYIPPSAVDSTVGLYIQAQHAGLPTRLLDWSTNPLAAIFFAVEEAGDRECQGGALFALDVAHLHVADEDDERVVDACEDLFAPYSPERSARFLENFATQPLAIEPNLRAGRMTQQASRFTFHFGLDEWPGVAVRVWFIPRVAKRGLLYQLDALNVNRATLFPDLENLAQHYAKGLDPSLRSYVFGQSLDELFEPPRG